MTVFDGITARIVDTPRLRVNVLERPASEVDIPDERTVVFVHGNVSSALFWQEIIEDLPADIRAIAVDLRGFGGSEAKPVDATRGLRDYADDLHATLQALHLGPVHLVGWSMGGGVVMQYALDHPVRSLTLQAPVSPYGFGGTRRDGSRLTDDDAGCGGGGANPEFIASLRAQDTTADSPSTARSVFRAFYVSGDYATVNEDVWVASMLSTSTAEGGYPGDSVPSSNWPGFGAGATGVLNTMTPGHFDTSGIVDLVVKPPILWVHGSADAIVSDASTFDLNQLGKLGVIPGWPGEDVAPAQPMVSQTRDVLAAYRAAGGAVTELELEGVGHAPHLERPGVFRRALLQAMGYIGPAHNPAPPTETIILRSAD